MLHVDEEYRYNFKQLLQFFPELDQSGFSPQTSIEAQPVETDSGQDSVNNLPVSVQYQEGAHQTVVLEVGEENPDRKCCFNDERLAII